MHNGCMRLDALHLKRYIDQRSLLKQSEILEGVKRESFMSFRVKCMYFGYT